MIAPQPWNLPKVTIDAWELPFSDVCMDLASQLRITVVPPAEAQTPITLSMYNVPAQQAADALAALVGLSAVYADGILRFSKEPETQFVLIDPGHEDPKQLLDLVGSIVGNDGVPRLVGQRIAVVAPLASLGKLSQLQQQLLTGADGWELTVLLFSVNTSLARNLGISATASGVATIGGRIDTDGLPDGVTPLRLNAAATVGALFEASQGNRHASLVTNGSLRLLEGTSAKLQQGEVVPVPRRTVSDAGTVTVVGYDRVESGFTLEASARRVPGGVRLELNPTISSITGYVEGSPILAQRALTASVVMESGEWMLLSGLETTSASSESTGLPGVPALNDSRRINDRSTLLLAVRVVRVSSTPAP